MQKDLASSVPSALASTGEQPDFARCLRCVSHELTRDVCWYVGRCVRQATPPSPAAVVDYTERARSMLEQWMRDWGGETSPYAGSMMTDLQMRLAAALSERDAAAIRAFGGRVWSDTEEVAYQAGVSDTRARLREPDLRGAVTTKLSERLGISYAAWAADAAINALDAKLGEAK
jgi:hypothetical protein